MLERFQSATKGKRFCQKCYRNARSKMPNATKFYDTHVMVIQSVWRAARSRRLWRLLLNSHRTESGLSSTDLGSTDTGSADSGPVDLGPVDLGPADLGPADLGPVDSGSVDLGSADLGSTDLGSAQVNECLVGRRGTPPCAGRRTCDESPPRLDGDFIQNRSFCPTIEMFKALVSEAVEDSVMPMVEENRQLYTKLLESQQHIQYLLGCLAQSAPHVQQGWGAWAA